MKTMIVLLTMTVISVTSAKAVAQDQPAKKLRAVAVTFDSTQANARRPLTRSERIRKEATLRSNKRLQAGYNQAIPF